MASKGEHKVSIELLDGLCLGFSKCNKDYTIMVG